MHAGYFMLQFNRKYQTKQIFNIGFFTLNLIRKTHFKANKRLLYEISLI